MACFQARFLSLNTFITRIIMVRRKARSRTPPIGISHSVQSWVAGWGGWGGFGGEVDWGSGGGWGGEVDWGSGDGWVEKALTALQAL